MTTMKCPKCNSEDIYEAVTTAYCNNPECEHSWEIAGARESLNQQLAELKAKDALNVCPECGSKLRKVGRGGNWNHRYVWLCDSCGWDDDAGTSQDLINRTCEAHGLVKRERDETRTRGGTGDTFNPYAGEI